MIACLAGNQNESHTEKNENNAMARNHASTKGCRNQLSERQRTRKKTSTQSLFKHVQAIANQPISCLSSK